MTTPAPWHTEITPLTGSPTPPPPKRAMRLRISLPALIMGILASGIAFHFSVSFLPTPRDIPIPREHITEAGTTLSPESAFIHFEERNTTNNPVTSLDIGDDDYVSLLPEGLGSLKNLTTLTIRNQPLHTLPDSIGNLTNLQSLIIINTPLTSLPESLGNLTNLEDLEIIGGRVTRLPISIGNLTKLKALALAYNHLTGVPRELSELTNLLELDLTGNSLQHIPTELPPHLKFIFLGANQIPRKALNAFDQTHQVKGVHF